MKEDYGKNWFEFCALLGGDGWPNLNKKMTEMKGCFGPGRKVFDSMYVKKNCGCFLTENKLERSKSERACCTFLC